jgi:hypothetical protein
MMWREKGRETYRSYCYERMRLRRSQARRRRAQSAGYSDSEMGGWGFTAERWRRERVWRGAGGGSLTIINMSLSTAVANRPKLPTPKEFTHMALELDNTRCLRDISLCSVSG